MSDTEQNVEPTPATPEVVAAPVQPVEATPAPAPAQVAAPVVEPVPAPQTPVQVPSIGRIVHYVLDNGRYPGEHRPAVIVKVAEDEQHETRLQLQVFTDGTGDFDRNQPGASGLLWREGVRYDDAKTPNSWHWPEYVPAIGL